MSPLATVISLILGASTAVGAQSRLTVPSILKPKPKPALTEPRPAPAGSTAVDKPKDYIFRGIPDYRILDQKRGFGQLTVKSRKPGLVGATYEGNCITTHYIHDAGQADPRRLPFSKFQIMRNQEEILRRMGGEVLYKSGDDYFHAEFRRNGRQYYMIFEVYNTGDQYLVQILEVEELVADEEILDAETILFRLEKEGRVILYLDFDVGKASIRPDSLDLIDEAAAALKTRNNLSVSLEGHIDTQPDAVSGKRLSEDRASAVRDALVSRGVNGSRLSVKGYGQERPIGDNGTDEGRAMNRRIEMVRL